MKFKSLILVGLLTLVGCVSQAQTNANVQLTPDQVAKLNAAVDQGVSLIPAHYQGLVDSAVGLLVILGTLGRVYKGWQTNGLPGVIAGVFHGTNTPLNPPAANISKGGANLIAHLLLCLALPTLLLTGCANTQVVDNTSGTGVHIKSSVVIPYTGGQSICGIDFAAGMWKNAAVIQPVSTNQLHGASLSIAQYTKGSASSSASAGSSTNSGVGVDGSSVDVNLITTGTSSIVSTNITLESKQ